MKNKLDVPFNKPFMTGRELHNISEANAHRKLAGDGPFTEKCHQWLENQTGSHRVLLTHSCTAALEMSALLLDIVPGDEVIMPSYAFVSTANAFVLRGAVPVFIDIRSDTLNIDETLIEAAITKRTKAIIVVHYAGVSCEMDAIMKIASEHRIFVVEDAAQGVMSRYKGKALGAIGHLGTYSFHETKNVISGEGGALLINEPRFTERAEIIREKGTDRTKFFRGEVDKYTWQDIGSSYLPGEITAAFLYAQLEEAKALTTHRLKLWNQYHQVLDSLERKEIIRRPVIPKDCEHNGHKKWPRFFEQRYKWKLRALCWAEYGLARRSILWSKRRHLAGVHGVPTTHRSRPAWPWQRCARTRRWPNCANNSSCTRTRSANGNGSCWNGRRRCLMLVGARSR